MTAHIPRTAEPAAAAETAARSLLFTQDATGPRGAAYERITSRAAIAFGTAFHLSGGNGDDEDGAVDAGLHNALHQIAPGITALVLHHLASPPRRGPSRPHAGAVGAPRPGRGRAGRAGV